VHQARVDLAAAFRTAGEIERQAQFYADLHFGALKRLLDRDEPGGVG
jgi:hypothetical protein